MATTNGTMVSLTIVALLAGLVVGADDPVAAVSDEVSLDTCSISAVAVPEDQTLDTRSYTEAYSPSRKLTTKKIKGTVILMR